MLLLMMKLYLSYPTFENTHKNGPLTPPWKGNHMYHYTLPVSNKNIIDISKRAFNLVDKRLIGHGSRVSYIVYQLLKASTDYTPRQTRDLLIVAALHDIGAYKTDEIDRMVEFETKNVWNHSIYGYLFLSHFTPFGDTAPAVLFHHTPWNKLMALPLLSGHLKNTAQIIHLADRIDIFLSYAKDNRDYKSFCRYVEERCPRIFNPEVIRLFRDTDLSFLFDTHPGAETNPLPEDPMDDEFGKVLDMIPFTEEERDAIVRMLIYAIDFRSPHTVTHTITTAVISAELARIFCSNETEANDIVCGAMLHDLGKIGIPTEILEFPGKLEPQAMDIMKSHVNLTEAILGNSVTQKVKDIALRHHEKLDGSGYPRGLKGCELTVPQRIVAIADIVSALTGTRSYKGSFPKEKTCTILNDMSVRGLIDSEIAGRVAENYDSIMETVIIKAAPTLETYHAMGTEYQELLLMLSRHVQP